MKKFWSWLSNASNSISIWQFISGTVLVAGFSLSAWAGYASIWLDSYGPIAWLICGLIGSLNIAFALYIVSVARTKWICATLQKQFHAEHDRINPQDVHFLNRRISLGDLLPPGNVSVSGKTFENCDIVGPLNIFPIATTIMKCKYVTCDYVAIKPITDEKPLNATVFENCRFINCRIFFVSFLVLEENYEYFDSMGGCHWITRAPAQLEMDLYSAP